MLAVNYVVFGSLCFYMVNVAEIVMLTKIMPQYQPGTMVMVCGPAQMMLAIRRDLLAMGYPPRAILSEEFAF